MIEFSDIGLWSKVAGRLLLWGEKNAPILFKFPS